jgi:hypothetical protein
MEQKGDLPIFTYPRDNFYKWDFPFNKSDATVPTSRYKPINPRINPTGRIIKPKTTEIETRGLRWIECPTTVQPSGVYTVIVRNSYYRKRVIQGDRVLSFTDKYYPTTFEFQDINALNVSGVSMIQVVNVGSATYAIMAIEQYATKYFYIHAISGSQTISKYISIGESYTPTVFTQDGYDILQDGVLFLDGSVTNQYTLQNYVGPKWAYWGMICGRLILAPPPIGTVDWTQYYFDSTFPVWEVAEGYVSSSLSYSWYHVTGSVTTTGGTYSIYDGVVT